ncbi:hypothetical protein ACU40O_09820 [Staphylococcus arlettae]
MSPEEETIINRNTMKLQEHLYKALKQRDQFQAERDTLIDDLAWYKAKVSRLERENRFLLSRKDNLFDSWRDENKRSVALSKRLEQLKRENGELQEVIEDKNSDLLFAEDENEQLKESRYWDYEYIIKVNEENKRLEDELKKKSMDADRLGYRWRDSHDKTKWLERENKRLKRLTHKLTTHRTMWDQLKKWRRDMLEIDTNDTQLISLGLVMDDLEKRHLYKERD